MRFFFLITQLYFVSFCFGQNRLEFKIISIDRTENKSKTDYTYTINYSVKNISSEEISFFLNKNKMECNAYGSLSNAVIYRFFQDNTVINAPIFNKPKELNPIEKEKRDAEMKIKVNHGVFMGNEGTVIRGGKKKVYVKLESLGHVMVVEFPAEYLSVM